MNILPLTPEQLGAWVIGAIRTRVERLRTPGMYVEPLIFDPPHGDGYLGSRVIVRVLVPGRCAWVVDRAGRRFLVCPSDDPREVNSAELEEALK